jgi:hypothetical protein
LIEIRWKAAAAAELLSITTFMCARSHMRSEKKRKLIDDDWGG